MMNCIALFISYAEGHTAELVSQYLYEHYIHLTKDTHRDSVMTFIIVFVTVLYRSLHRDLHHNGHHCGAATQLERWQRWSSGAAARSWRCLLFNLLRVCGTSRTGGRINDR